MNHPLVAVRHGARRAPVIRNDGAGKVSLHQGVLPAIGGAPADVPLLNNFGIRISNFGFSDARSV